MRWDVKTAPTSIKARLRNKVNKQQANSCRSQHRFDATDMERSGEVGANTRRICTYTFNDNDVGHELAMEGEEAESWINEVEYQR